MKITFQEVVVQHCIQEGRQMVAVEEVDHWEEVVVGQSHREEHLEEETVVELPWLPYTVGSM